MLVVFELGVIRTERRGNADDQIMGLRSDFALQGLNETSVDVLHAAAPATVGNGNRLMDRIVKNRCLAIGVRDPEPDVFVRGKESIGLGGWRPFFA